MERDLRQAPSLLRRQDCLLVIIDMQEKLHRVMEGKEALAANVLRLAKFAGVAGLPVVVSEQANLGPTLAEIAQALPAGSPKVDKIAFDCFASPAFQELLWQQDKGTLVLCGIEAHICVAQTALSGLVGHRVQVIADAVASRVEANRRVALTRLAQAGAVISSTEMFMYEILGQAGSDEFRQVLRLVK
jgi:nicotinamidase-related amidase